VRKIKCLVIKSKLLFLPTKSLQAISLVCERDFNGVFIGHLIIRVYEYCHKTLSNRRGKAEVIQKIYS
jgi:hypothetical protein